MKKISIISYLLLIFFSTFVFAETGKTLTEQLDMKLVGNNQINKVAFKFCNYGFEQNQLTPSLDMVMRPNQKKDICVVFGNQSNDSLRVVASVVPGEINANGNMICSNNGQLTGDLTVSDFEELSWIIILGPQEQIIKHFTVSSTESASGKYDWCLAINLETSEKLSETSPFSLVVRKAWNIKISVIGEPYRFQWFDNIFSWISKNIRTIAKIGIIICSILLIYSLVPVFRSKKKTSKNPTHKK